MVEAIIGNLEIPDHDGKNNNNQNKNVSKPQIKETPKISNQKHYNENV